MNRFNIVSNSLINQKNDNDDDDIDKAEEEPENEETHAASTESTDSSQQIKTERVEEPEVFEEIVQTLSSPGNAHFFEIIHVEVVLPEESKLIPETIDSTYWKVPLAADDLEDLLSDYE